MATKLRVKRSFKDEDGRVLNPGDGFETDNEALARQLISKGYAEEARIPGIEELGELEEEEEPEVEEPKITPDQNKKLHAQYRELGWDEDEATKRAFLEQYGVEHTNELTRQQAADAIENLSERTEQREVVYRAKTGGGLKQVLRARERTPSLVGLADSVERVKATMKSIERALKEILDLRPTQHGGDITYFLPDGTTTTNPREAARSYIVRSGLRKIAFALSLDLEILNREKLQCRDGKGEYYIWRTTVRVVHPKGRFIVQDGACSSRDKFFTKGGRKTVDEEDVMHKSATVAYNRAIMDLTGVKIGKEEAY